jgi:hypothetical protein
MSVHLIWHGTETEMQELIAAVVANCGCTSAILEKCGAHRMLFEDQRALNGLLWARRLKDQRRYQEWNVPAMRSPE